MQFHAGSKQTLMLLTQASASALESSLEHPHAVAAACLALPFATLSGRVCRQTPGLPVPMSG